MNRNLLRYGIPAGCVAIIGGVLAGVFAGGGGPAPEKAKIEAEQAVEATKASLTGEAKPAEATGEAKPADSSSGDATATTEKAATEAAPGEKAASEAASSAEKAVDAAGEAASSAADAVSSAADAAVDAASDAASATADAASDTAKAAVDAAESAASATAEAVEGVAKDAEGAASDAASAVTDTAKSVVEGAAKAVEEGAAAVGDAVSGESSPKAGESGATEAPKEAPASPESNDPDKGADAGATAAPEETEVASASAEPAATGAAEAATPSETATAGEATAAPTTEATPAKPSFDVVRINPNGGTVMAGRAEPGAEIAIMDGDKEIGRVTADRNGDWVFTREAPMAPGDRELSLKDVGPGGQQSDQVVVLSVPEPKAEEKPGAVAVMQDREGGQTVVLQVPEEPKVAAAADQPFASIDSIDYATNGEITVAGRAAPGAKLNIYIDNGFVGGIQAGPDGRWSFAPGDALTVGEHTLRIDSVGDAGSVLARAETPLTREPATRLAPPGETLVIVQPGNSLWRIARRTLGGGIHYSEIFQANREQIRDPDLIYPGQIFTVPLG